MVSTETRIPTPPAPNSSPQDADTSLLHDPENLKRVDFTLKEVADKVSQLEKSIDAIRLAREAEVKKKAELQHQTESIDEWRVGVAKEVAKKNTELDQSVNSLEVELFKLTEMRNKKILVHKQEREKLKQEVEMLERAGSEFLALEMRLVQSLAADAKRLATRTQQVHNATIEDLSSKMKTLTEGGEKQFIANKNIIGALEAEILSERAAFWEHQKLRKYGQDSALVAMMPTAADAHIQTAIGHVKSGDVLMRFHPKTGKKEEIWVQLDVTCNYMVWQRLNTKANSLNVQASRLDLLNDAIDVVFGARSPSFFLLNHSPPIQPWLCFSIVSRDGKTIDLAAHDDETSFLWFLALQTFIPSDFKIDGSVRNRRLTRQQLLWKRAHMKLGYAAQLAGTQRWKHLARRVSMAVEQVKSGEAPTSTTEPRPDERRYDAPVRHSSTVSSIGAAPASGFGVAVIKLALAEGVITKDDLANMSDKDLQHKVYEGIKTHASLRNLVREHLSQLGRANSAPLSSVSSGSSDDDDDDDDTSYVSGVDLPANGAVHDKATDLVN
eukprot:c8529_g1_i1.p1 GENE.c8529_g1_i1~~c8529_g1_i1.p1  ORF type:complete len:553 (+),score=143.88 c8529_g1_i1:426-2084(+)